MQANAKEIAQNISNHSMNDRKVFEYGEFFLSHKQFTHTRTHTPLLFIISYAKSRIGMAYLSKFANYCAIFIANYVLNWRTVVFACLFAYANEAADTAKRNV